VSLNLSNWSGGATDVGIYGCGFGGGGGGAAYLLG